MKQLVLSLAGACLLMGLSLAALLALQIFVYRFRIFTTMGRNLFMISLYVCVAEILSGPIVLSPLVQNIYDRWLVSILSGIASFGLIGIYLMIFPISLERSFSIRLLVNMLKRKNGAFDKAAVEALHTREQIYELRYREMTDGGLIKIEGNKLMLLPRGRLIARLYLLLGQSMGYPEGFNN